MNSELLNNFVNEIFGYNLKDDEYVYIQYKIVKDNIVLNIFDNGNDNRFKAYIFSNDTFTNDDNIVYINIKECYDMYKQRNTKDKLLLLGALLIALDNNEKKEIIETLFDNDIKRILIKHFI